MHKTLKTTLYLALNVTFSICIVLLNKWIYTRVHFPNMTLSMLHFTFTFLGLCVCERMNVFNIKSVHINQMIILSICFCGFVVLTNLSLAYNSIGTFQVAKVLTTPTVVLIQMIFYGKHFSARVKLTLIPVILGVIVTFYFDIKLNLVGSVFAILGVLVTSLYQVLVNVKQSELQMSSMQLLYYQAPMSAVLLCVCIPFREPLVDTLSHSWSLLDIVLVLSSCVVALGFNLTTYWIIGNTSPLTYNMVGHTKFCLIMIGGWLLLQEHLTVNQLFGILLTLSGIVLYTQAKLMENERMKAGQTQTKC